MALLVALFDTLAGDLRRAASAQRVGDLEQRARMAKHALAVIAFLENWLDGEDGALAQQLIRFYGGLRRSLMEAQVKQSAALFEQLMSEVLGIRELWQKVEAKEPEAVPHILPPVARQHHTGSYGVEIEQRQLSWSA